MVADEVSCGGAKVGRQHRFHALAVGVVGEIRMGKEGRWRRRGCRREGQRGYTCATQLLNAGCRVTSIQRFLGHKKLSCTMIYARAHDQTVAEDYFAAMERVEQRLDTSTLLSASIVPAKQKDIEVAKVQEPTKVFQLIERLELPELGFEERLDITLQLRELFGVVQELESVMVFA